MLISWVRYGQDDSCELRGLWSERRYEHDLDGVLKDDVQKAIV